MEFFRHTLGFAVVRIEAGDAYRRFEQDFVVSFHALNEYYLSATERADTGNHLQQIVEPRRLEVLGGNRADGEGNALRRQPVLLVSHRPQALGTGALEELQVAGVVDHARGIGILVIDAYRQAERWARHRAILARAVLKIP